MRCRTRCLGLLLGLLGELTSGAGPEVAYSRSTIRPPKAVREFRGAWIATVNNIDWPSKPGLPVAQQKSELFAIIRQAHVLQLNALVLQIRPTADALYESRLEPWSPFLTGQMGTPPQPAWDPLAFAVTEAHRYGIELHAWINPFRARFTTMPGTMAESHVSRRLPDLVRTYGKYLWLDPGESRARDHSMNVILDVVQRYDIDGIHIDDYFYPYPERNARREPVEFPDDPPWRRYVAGGGKLARDDWRRENINQFVQRLYREVKARKPWVKVGISPFGIWRPNNPPGIRGMDQYDEIYADARKWISSGWADYFAPQLYWAIDPPEQSFPVLLRWWTEQNAPGRHVWPGINTANLSSAKWRAPEILNQIRRTRQLAGATGVIHWNVSALMRNSGGVTKALSDSLYREPALVPASPWLDNRPPGTPILRATPNGPGILATWTPAAGEGVWRWVLQWRVGDVWRTYVAPARQRSYRFEGTPPQTIAVTAVDRTGNTSASASIVRSR